MCASRAPLRPGKDLLECLQQAAPAALHGLLEDWFQTINLYHCQARAGIDPDNYLIDRQPDDNLIAVIR